MPLDHPPPGSEPPDAPDQRLLGGWPWEALLHGTEAGVAILDSELRFRYVNPALARMNGVPVEAHLGRTMAEVVPGVVTNPQVMRDVLADGRPREMLSSGQTLADSPHSRRHWQGSYHRVRDTGGRVLGVCAVILEVTADK
jgi:PAS domain S-box-containing protein